VEGNLVRLGGVFGLLAVLLMIPAYLVGYPDAPGSPEEATSYFDAGPGAFVFFNGVLPLFHVLFFLLFLGVLYGVLRRAGEGTREVVGGGLPAMVLAGGLCSRRSKQPVLRWRLSTRQRCSASGRSKLTLLSCSYR
jgi:hypothetical protein